MSQVYKNEDKDSTDATEMHDNPLRDPDEEQGQVTVATSFYLGQVQRQKP